MQHAPLLVASPFAVAMHLGIRGGDVIRVPEKAYKNGFLRISAGKNGLFMPYPSLTLLGSFWTPCRPMTTTPCSSIAEAGLGARSGSGVPCSGSVTS